MEHFIHLFLLLPFSALLFSLLLPATKEKWISGTAFVSVGLQFLLGVAFTIYWLFHQHHTISIKDLSLFKSEGYEFFISLYFDKVTAVYLLVGAFLTFMVTMYSRFYMHRENGYKRFFNTILFFYLGYNITILSGNIETLFIGWEMLGISSFLLIAFYWHRYLPVKNAMKVFSVYRIGDIGLILAMWMSHHLWHENVTFAKLNNAELVNHHLQEHSFIGIAITAMILLAAAAKSAQLPFSSWLPRAMEGPTPSSAIFYASLSVHIGAFILLRTYPFWEHQTVMKILIISLGLCTSAVASAIGRVQSSIKSQVAYSSISQIGLIFVEIAFGLDDLALIHFAGNAFLRTYQLLVSPSVVSYLIREQFFNFKPRPETIEDSFPKRMAYSFYMLSVKEFNLDMIMYRYLWSPIKWVGYQLRFLTFRRAFILFFPLYALGLFFLFVSEEIIPAEVKAYLPAVFSLFGLALTLKAFSERKHVLEAWFYLIMNHCWNALAISFNEHFNLQHVFLYLSGVVVSGIAGLAVLRYLQQREKNFDLANFHGHSFEHPRLAFVFLLSCLGMTGFPITPTFIGEDLIFSHIHSDQYV
ncbi:MAG: hypothetical protein K1X56_12870, partial [Flavobacteriales bacterium]|nr:hypothetical protein [Flavobacteriales bacterium]